MRFSFIHAADLHIDSPLLGLRRKDPAVAARFAGAGRRAVEALIRETIDSEAAFLIIAGDIFDGDWKDVTTGLFFARAMGELHRAGIPVFIVKGNHDAASVMSRDLPLPDTVSTFPAGEASTVRLDTLRVALHGRSFPNRVTDAFVESYPARVDGWLNIGVLHTSLDGTRGHEGYAPCSIETLKRFGYDYWALGHIHAAEIVARDPWIVFPGNLQGRSVRETGAKGAARVTVEDGRVIDVTPVTLDGARWAHPNVDIADISTDTDLITRVDAALSEAHAAGEGRPLAVRVTLVGETALHNQLVARRERLEEDLRAMAFRFADDCWLESLRLRTNAPARPLPPSGADDHIDINQLLTEAAADPEFIAARSELLDGLMARLPRDLGDDFAASDAVKNLITEAHAILAADAT